jgi:hypothetical protein
VPNRNLLGELPDPIGALTLDDWASVLSDRLIIVTPGCLVFEPWLDNVTNLVLDQTGHAPVVVVMPGGALGLYPAPMTVLSRFKPGFRSAHNLQVGKQLTDLATEIDNHEVGGGVLIMSHATRCPDFAGRFAGPSLHRDPANEARTVHLVTSGAGLAVMAWNLANGLYDLPVWTVALRTCGDTICTPEFRPVPAGFNGSLQPLEVDSAQCTLTGARA